MGREVGNVVQALRIWKGCRAMLLKNVNLSATKLVISGSTNKRMRVGYREKKRKENICVIYIASPYIYIDHWITMMQYKVLCHPFRCWA